MKRQKKIAVINDFSGFGRCSLTVSIPIISAMKIQCCALPTAIFSNHTGYSDYFFDDYTEKMREYYSKWEKLGLDFDGIYTGFLGSVKQVRIVRDFIETFSDSNTKIIVDPVMGDNGKKYATFDDELCREIKKLLPKANIITPNITEACILSETEYKSGEYSEFELLEIAEKLHNLGAENIIITGIEKGNEISNFVHTYKNEHFAVAVPVSGTSHAGTGDVFASVIAADAVQGIPLKKSVEKAANFTAQAIRLSDEMHIASQDGVCFEEILSLLST